MSGEDTTGGAVEAASSRGRLAGKTVGRVAALAVAGIGLYAVWPALLAHRLVSFWLPLPAGLVAYIVYQRRYCRPDEELGNVTGSPVAGVAAESDGPPTLF